jgi:capsular polysaccharide biosynthesis protein
VELHDYWTIIRRRWWWPLGFMLVAFVLSSAVAVRGAAAFKTEMRLAVSSIPNSDPATERFFDPIYYSNLNSEYLADDLGEFLHSQAFAGEVARDMGDPDLDIVTMANATRTKKTHRFIDVTLTTSTYEEGQAIATAMERILNDPVRLASYLRALETYKASIAVVTPPETRRNNTVAGVISEVGLRTLVGVIFGLAIAFLLDYLDSSVRTRREVEDLLELPVLGEIPRTRRGAAA